MALISADPIYDTRNDVIGFEWLVVTDADTCAHVEMPHKSDKTIQVSGDFGTGGNIAAEGTLDPAPGGANFVELDDPQGTNIAILADGVETILQNVFFIRPNVAAGTSVDVTIRIMG